MQTPRPSFRDFDFIGLVLGLDICLGILWFQKRRIGDACYESPDRLETILYLPTKLYQPKWIYLGHSLKPPDSCIVGWQELLSFILLLRPWCLWALATSTSSPLFPNKNGGAAIERNLRKMTPSGEGEKPQSRVWKKFEFLSIFIMLQHNKGETTAR